MKAASSPAPAVEEGGDDEDDFVALEKQAEREAAAEAAAARATAAGSAERERAGSEDGEAGEGMDQTVIEDEGGKGVGEETPRLGTHLDASGDIAEQVKVLVRIRPLARREYGYPVCTRVAEDGRGIEVGGVGKRTFMSRVDRVLGEEATQDEVYAESRKYVTAALDGVNSTVFAYGQTGTGKTHSMLGRELRAKGMAKVSKERRAVEALLAETSALAIDEEGEAGASTQGASQEMEYELEGDERGIVPRAVEEILRRVTDDQSNEYSVKMAFLQIYGNRMYDLLCGDVSADGAGKPEKGHKKRKDRKGSPSSSRPSSSKSERKAQRQVRRAEGVLEESAEAGTGLTSAATAPVGKERKRWAAAGTAARLAARVEKGKNSVGFSSSVPVKSDGSGMMDVVEDKTWGVTVRGLNFYDVTSRNQVSKMLRKGARQRALRHTMYNEASSRSHTILQFKIEIRPRDQVTGEVDFTRVRRGKLNLVDLAGSERWQSEGESGAAHVQELRDINQSLAALGKVITALSRADSQVEKGAAPIHVPYRDSALTRMLQDSLGGNARTMMLATVSPAERALAETCSTLRFADNAKRVMVRIRVNEQVGGEMVLARYAAEIDRLRGLLRQLTGGEGGGAAAALLMQGGAALGRVRDLEERNRLAQEELRAARKEADKARVELERERSERKAERKKSREEMERVLREVSEKNSQPAVETPKRQTSEVAVATVTPVASRAVSRMSKVSSSDLVESSEEEEDSEEESSEEESSDEDSSDEDSSDEESSDEESSDEESEEESEEESDDDDDNGEEASEEEEEEEEVALAAKVRVPSSRSPSAGSSVSTSSTTATPPPAIHA